MSSLVLQNFDVIQGLLTIMGGGLLLAVVDVIFLLRLLSDLQKGLRTLQIPAVVGSTASTSISTLAAVAPGALPALTLSVVSTAELRHLTKAPVPVLLAELALVASIELIAVTTAVTSEEALAQTVGVAPLVREE